MNESQFSRRPAFIPKASLKMPLFFLVLLSGIFLLYPFLDYQAMLSQGDHGRDLYAFEQTMNGAKAYTDYWWVYGPLMPYYYAFFIKFLGINVVSILFGKMILNLLSGVFLYLALGAIFGRAVGFFTSLWFWSFSSDFFFTYNHAGGITFMTLSLAVLFHYLNHGRVRRLWMGLTAVFLLSFVKVNVGLACLVAYLFSIFLIDVVHKNSLSREKKILYLIGVLVIPIIILLIYTLLLRGLTIDEIRQCLPYIKGDQPYSTDPLTPVKILWETTIQNIRMGWINTALAGLLICSIVHCLWLLCSPHTYEDVKKKIFLTLAILAIFFLVNVHEFIMSGVYYRYFWAKPFQISLIFACVGFGIQNIPKSLRILLSLLILFIIGQEAVYKNAYLKDLKTAQHYLDLPRLKIFTENMPDWDKTVKDTTLFLQRTLKENDLFFALPYDPLYYYTTGRRSPTRQLIFFDHIHIPMEQEYNIIGELEKNKTNYVLLSSRMSASEHGLGTLGINYCPVIARYLNEYFELIAKFGDWQHNPGWAWHHGTMILRRKNPEVFKFLFR